MLTRNPVRWAAAFFVLVVSAPVLGLGECDGNFEDNAVIVSLA